MTSSPVTPSAVDDAPDWPAAFVRRYLDAGHWQDQSFAEALATSAARHPRRIALCDDDQRLSYADLLQRCRRLAAGLRQAGLAHGDTVVLHLPNGIAFVETCFALFQLGVRPVLALPPIASMRSAVSAASPRPRPTSAPNGSTASTHGRWPVSCSPAAPAGWR